MGLFDDFEVPTRGGRESDSQVLQKLKTAQPKAVTVRGGGKGGIANQIASITDVVDKYLGKYKDVYQPIQDLGVLHDYISECIGNGYISIDTETDGLDPLQNHIAGICIYTPNQKGSYIPLNHINYITNEPLKHQLIVDDVAKEFDRLLKAKPYIDMFNSSFDIRVLRNQANIKDIYCTWDGYLAQRLLNENEPSNALKKLHQKYILNGEEDEFRFDELFRGVVFTKIPISTAYLYASHDPVVTKELCDYQRQFMRADSDRDDMKRLYWVMDKIEMPLVKVVADMEDMGIKLDLSYNEMLKEKYHKLLDDAENEFYDVCSHYQKQIDTYVAKNPNAKLDTPINISSPTQLAILLYDILGIDTVDKKSPRGTGVEILTKIDNDIAKAVLKYRGVEKLISTYIDKLPECVNPNDGRVHCKFNQYGADTGRMSSSDPNLQNIPSHNSEIRQMFVASDGYVLMSSDYSQQEPSCLASFCKEAGSDALFDARFKGNDLYSEVASACFNMPYEMCCEFDKDGNKNPKEYKERRSQAKPILLGILYGRGDKSVAEQLHCSVEEAQQLKANLFKRFPEIHNFERDSLQMAHDVGYVTTVCGRKRRLPDLQLDEFEFSWIKGKCPYDDPLDFDNIESIAVPQSTVRSYVNKLQRARFNQKAQIIADARKEGIQITDNGGKIADATRQCVNARIQGSASDLTKLAMINLHNNEHLKELGFRMLIPVHDEVVCECPRENAKECSELLAKVMSDTAQEILHMPFSCDVELSVRWYGESIKI